VNRKGFRNLATLCSLLTELLVLFSALSYRSWTLTKYAHSWLSSKIKFISLLLWDVVQCKVAVSCIIPVCYTTYQKKDLNCRRQKPKVLQEQIFLW